MSFIHGKKTVVKLSGVDGALTDISAFLDSADYDSKADRPETQAFGKLGKKHEVTGLRDATLAVSGFLQRVAATKLHGKGSRLMHDQYALSGYLQKAAVKLAVDCPETQAFGDLWKRHAPTAKGLMSADVSFDGMFDSGASALDQAWRAALAVDPPGFSLLDLAPEGFALGNLVQMVQGVLTDYKLGSKEGALVSANGQFMSDDQFDLGVSLHDLTAEVAALNLTSVDSAAATANGGVGHIHVTAFTGTSATIKIQHSTDNSAWVDLITFTAVTAATKERIELAAGTAVNRYIRAIISAFTGGSPSITFTATFARRTYVNATLAPAGTFRCWHELLLIASLSTFEYGPEGSATGAKKFSGSCVVPDMSYDLDENGIERFNATIVSDGVVAEGAY